MWWTAITLAGVAAWFEWTYRRNRKAAGDDKKKPQASETSAQQQLEQAGSMAQSVDPVPSIAPQARLEDRLGTAEKSSLSSEEHSLP